MTIVVLGQVMAFVYAVYSKDVAFQRTGFLPSLG